jgi:hypothetical protein
MNTNTSSLNDDTLIAELGHLAGRERAATVALIVHLAEFDARRLYAREGYSSTFRYCTAVLRLSEDAAFNRIEVARAARTYPLLLDRLLSGALSPTTARLLAPRLTPENHEDLLAAASGRSRREVEELIARRFPQPDVPSSIRRRPVVAAPASSPMPPLPDAPTPAAATRPAGPAAPVATRRPVVRPLATDRFEIRFTSSADTRDLLREAQDLLAHAVPSGDLDQVFNRALRLLVQDLERKKFATTDRPRRSPGQSEDSRNIPASVKRAVRRRDEARCAWTAPTGHRCDERRFLEYHHDDPYGVGGKPVVDRVRLLCRTHNGHEAALFYGPRRAYGGIAVPGRVGATRERGERTTRPGDG